MSFLEIALSKGGRVETAGHALYDAKSDSWLTSVFDNVECIVVFQSADMAGNYLDSVPHGKATVRKVSMADIAREVAQSKGHIYGLLLVTATGEMRRFIVRDPRRLN